MRKSVRIIGITALLIVCLVGAFTIAGCTHNHIWIDYVTFNDLIGVSASKVEPTCTKDGYANYKCMICSEIKQEILPATGHDVVVDKKGIAATCTSNGRDDVSHCKTCNAKLGVGTVLPKIPHTPYLIGEDVEATCFSVGIQAERRCSECSSLISERSVIPKKAHTMVTDVAAVPASCTTGGFTATRHCSECDYKEERTATGELGHDYKVSANTATCKIAGVCTYTCTRCTDSYVENIEAMGHADTDLNKFCDRCNRPYGSHVKYISDANGLAAIAADLNGAYVLTENISLSGLEWMPIGTKQQPFTGVLYGDGFSITGIKQINRETGGIFAYNSGIIDCLNVSEFEIGMKREINGSCGQNEAYAVGALCAYNNGTIRNCNISGTNVINSVSWFGIKVTNGGADDTKFSCTVGGFCAVNGGIIQNCEVAGTVNFTYSHTTKFEFVKSGFYLVGDDDCAKGTNNCKFGNIAAVNSGTINDCKVSANTVGSIKMVANQCGTTYGTAYSTGTLYAGALVGENTSTGNIVTCSSKNISYTRNIGTSWRGANCGEVVTFTEKSDATYGGRIAANSGKVSNFVPLY